MKAGGLAGIPDSVPWFYGEQGGACVSGPLVLTAHGSSGTCCLVGLASPQTEVPDREVFSTCSE